VLVGDTFAPMVRPFLRSVACALLTACFALGAFAWGAMPGCETAAGTPPAAHHFHGQGASHHPTEPGHLPSITHCVVHLCCVQLVTPAVAILAPAHFSSPSRATGLVSATVFVAGHPSHVLPFAHAPPPISA
jgi:hypothetical protein